MKPLGLPKYTRLCSTTAIDRLFERDAAAWCVAPPLRSVWREAVVGPRMSSLAREHGSIRFVITVPKKKLRHAVDRVAMRRRVREAYRLCRKDYETLLPSGTVIDLAFIYTAHELMDFQQVQRSVHRILGKVTRPYISATHE